MTLRLFVTADLGIGPLLLDRDHSHYVATVMRARQGDEVLLFNGRDGEWGGLIDSIGRAGVTVSVAALIRPQAAEPDLWLLAAPIKKERIDLVAEKAAELGASALWPVFTRHTVMSRVNGERLEAHLREAAEQCERLSVPEFIQPASLEQVLAGWDATRTLLFLDESGGGQPLAQALADLSARGGTGGAGPLAILVGPEGGFAAPERDLLARQSFTCPVGLGPRILRAETAAIAALAIVQALWGDWSRPPRG